MLNPGLFVRVRLPVGDAHEAVMIRERAIVTNHGVKGVYILSDRDKNDQPIKSAPDAKGNTVPTRRAVWNKIGNPGVVRDGFVEIAKGVRAGEWVVVSGMQRLWDNKTVKAEKYAGDAPADRGKQDSESTVAVPSGAHQAARLTE